MISRVLGLSLDWGNLSYTYTRALHQLEGLFVSQTKYVADLLKKFRMMK